MDNYFSPTVWFEEFYEIPKYSLYAISKTGLVINKKTSRLLSGSRNPDGYINVRITGDDRHCLTWGLHRLLCYVFKNPGIDISSLVVNHINADKGDNRLENLEWVSYQSNAEHAGALGLTTKCAPISVRNVDTGAITHYPSIISCARDFNVSKDFINYRVNAGEKRIFPERKQYRLYSNKDWYIPESIEHEIMKNGTSKSVVVKNVMTGKIVRQANMYWLAKMLNISHSTLTKWINTPGQPVLPNFIQVKWGYDLSPWREVEDPYLEFSKFTGNRIIKTVNDANGEIKIYTSAKNCADDRGLSQTALSYRLKSNGNNVFSDGYRYGYYPY